MPEYKSRTDIPIRYKWDLTLMYADESAWEAEFARVPALLDDLCSYDGRLGESLETVRSALLAHERASRLIDKLWQYAARHRDENMADSHYGALFDRANGLRTELDEATAFLSPQLLSLEL